MDRALGQYGALLPLGRIIGNGDSVMQQRLIVCPLCSWYCSRSWDTEHLTLELGER